MRNFQNNKTASRKPIQKNQSTGSAPANWLLFENHPDTLVQIEQVTAHAPLATAGRTAPFGYRPSVMNWICVGDAPTELGVTPSCTLP